LIIAVVAKLVGIDEPVVARDRQAHAVMTRAERAKLAARATELIGIDA
jgi:hypothetical protein